MLESNCDAARGICFVQYFPNKIMGTSESTEKLLGLRGEIFSLLSETLITMQILVKIKSHEMVYFDFTSKVASPPGQ